MGNHNKSKRNVCCFLQLDSAQTLKHLQEITRTISPFVLKVFLHLLRHKYKVLGIKLDTLCGSM